jgi:hypothetical protein
MTNFSSNTNTTMPPSKPGASTDVRRTITPAGAYLRVSADGFSVQHADDTIASIGWSQVEAIFAYTRFIAGRGNLCLAFVLLARPRRRADQVVVHDGLEGWRSLVDALAAAFPSADNHWASKASVDSETRSMLASRLANNVVNPTQVWPPLADIPA